MEKFYRIGLSGWKLIVKVKVGELVTVYENGRKRRSYNEKNVVAWCLDVHQTIFGPLYKKQGA